LQELYDDNNHASDSRQHDMPVDNSSDRNYNHWSNMPRHSPHMNQHHISVSAAHRHDAAMMRRNTFPYVRQDREDGPLYIGEHDSFGSRSVAIYSDSPPMDGSPHISLSGEPSSLHLNRVDGFHAMSNSSASSFHDFDHPDRQGVKMEDHSPVIISSNSAYCQGQQTSQNPLVGYMSQHGIPIQHTDDAASKETQYLRRRCFNCHTTEPPSWRRSTLTPGKIVCNKCGLYERTHLRPRPLRFDELRAGNKSRKQPKESPKSGKAVPPGSLPVKKEPSELDAISRRLSVSSNSSVQSGGGSSDWDDGSEFLFFYVS
jgi:GATA-binding protein